MTPGSPQATAVNVCLTHDPAFAGLYRAVNDFARALDAPVVSFDDGCSDRSALAAAEPCRVWRIPTGRGWLTQDCHVVSAAAARQAEEVTAGAGLLVVHSLFRGHAPWAAGVAHRRGVPYWAVPHGCLDPWGLSQRRWLKRAWLAVHGRVYFSGAERIVFATRREAEKARPWIPAARGTVIHWPVEVPEVVDPSLRRHRFRERLAVDDSQRLLLSVGRLHSMKRPIETVEAFCAAEAGNCHLALVGMDGDLSAAQIRAAIPAVCRSRVHVVGALAGANLQDAYLAADGFISLSFRENFGYAAAEAVAYGLPVILSPGHDLAYELPRTGTQLACGWLLPGDSRTAAVAAIRAFGEAPAAAVARLSSAGAGWAQDVLAFSRFRDSLVSLAGRGVAVP